MSNKPKAKKENAEVENLKAQLAEVKEELTQTNEMTEYLGQQLRGAEAIVAILVMNAGGEIFIVDEEVTSYDYSVKINVSEQEDPHGMLVTVIRDSDA